MTTNDSDNHIRSDVNEAPARIAMNNQSMNAFDTSTSRNAAGARARVTMRRGSVAALLALAAVGCGPTFDPPSLIEGTRVLGARVEVSGADNRAAPAPGESATVTWLMTAPGAMPALGWAFALCAPSAPGALSCDTTPLAIYQGSDSPPRVTIAVPPADALGPATRLILYGQICAGSAPIFDAQTGRPACEGGAAAEGQGTTASVIIGVNRDGTDANHNPIADHSLTFDGQPWASAAPGDDPCVTAPRVSAGTDDHVIAVVTAAADRESFTALVGDPPVATPQRESLQISHFATDGKLANPFSFIEGDVTDGAPAASVKWKTPKAKDVTAPTVVAFTFVVRDSRGGTDWTTRAACVAP
jgi:hypothetical protein